MERVFRWLLAIVVAATPMSGQRNILHTARNSTGDLELGGELIGLPSGTTRYVRYDDLLRLPQERYTVRDDTNFRKETVIEGIPLETVSRLFGQAASDDSMIVAICYDEYRTNYPREYLGKHRPLLVLRIDGQLREHWPPSEHGGPMGPYLISHPSFKPAFRVLSHEDEPQIPFGVTRIELRRQSIVFSAIEPPGKWPEASQIGQGYAIARQDCFRCHNMGSEGGTLAARSWLQLAKDAQEDDLRFRQTIRNPGSVRRGAKMPAHSTYDDATLRALSAYFRTFASAGGTR